VSVLADLQPTPALEPGGFWARAGNEKLSKNRRERRQFVVARAAETAVYGSNHEDFEHRTAA